MAQYRLGQGREAEQTLRAAREALERFLHPAAGQPQLPLRARLHLSLLRREAEATLAKPSGPSKKQ
jgi:hypothetical protein